MKNSKKNVALITGITGQDGSYLAEFLLEKNYEVHGIVRRSSNFNTQRVDHLYKEIYLHYGDITDPLAVINLISKIKPTEIYNLAAQSHVKVSFEIPGYTAQVDAVGTLNLLEAIRSLSLETKVKFYQASTSELYGLVQEIPQNENTPFYPRSPYGVAKLYGYWIVKNYRESYSMFAVSGILFNHESPRRGKTFVTKKIVDGLREISMGSQNIIELGNLNSLRDWGHAKDYVRAMWMMLQHEEPDDFVIATGKQFSVREFATLASKHFGMEIIWKGSGLNEVGYDKNSGQTIFSVNKKYFRPAEVDTLLGDPTKAMKILGWTPEISFEELVEDMCKNGA